MAQLRMFFVIVTRSVCFVIGEVPIKARYPGAVLAKIRTITDWQDETLSSHRYDSFRLRDLTILC